MEACLKEKKGSFSETEYFNALLKKKKNVNKLDSENLKWFGRWWEDLDDSLWDWTRVIEIGFSITAIKLKFNRDESCFRSSVDWVILIILEMSK